MTGTITTDTITSILTTLKAGTTVVILCVDVDAVTIELDGESVMVEPEAIEVPTMAVIHDDLSEADQEVLQLRAELDMERAELAATMRARATDVPTIRTGSPSRGFSIPLPSDLGIEEL